jgi:hypothetical protein
MAVVVGLAEVVGGAVGLGDVGDFDIDLVGC